MLHVGQKEEEMGRHKHLSRKQYAHTHHCPLIYLFGYFVIFLLEGY